MLEDIASAGAFSERAWPKEGTSIFVAQHRLP